MYFTCGTSTSTDGLSTMLRHCTNMVITSPALGQGDGLVSWQCLCQDGSDARKHSYSTLRLQSSYQQELVRYVKTRLDRETNRRKVNWMPDRQVGSEPGLRTIFSTPPQIPSSCLLFVQPHVSAQVQPSIWQQCHIANIAIRRKSTWALQTVRYKK